MKKTIVFGITILCYMLTISNVTAQSWTKKTNVPTNRLGTFTFTVGDALYVGGGMQKDLLIFDSKSHTWSTKTMLPGVKYDRTFGFCFMINGKAYIGGGTDSTRFTVNDKQTYDMWEYNPATNQWIEKSGVPIHPLAAFDADNRGFLIGVDSTMSAAMYEYNAANDSWIKRTAHPGPYLQFPFVFSMGGKGYVACGSINTEPSTKVYEYNPDNDTWAEKANFIGAAREAGSSFVMDGKAYCGFGTDNFTTYYNDFFVFDPVANSWDSVGTFPSAPRVYAAAGVAGGQAFAGSGWAFVSSSKFYNDWFQFSIPTSIKEGGETKSQISCYPNPATNKLIIGVPEGESAFNYIIYNIIGEEVLSGSLSQPNIDIKAIDEGQYIIKLYNSSNSNAVHTIKFVKS